MRDSDNMKKRGIIVTNPFRSATDGSTVIGSISPHDIRHYVLYWDLIDWPNNPLIGVAESDDIRVLKSEGILSRTMIAVSSFNPAGRGADILQASMQLNSFFENNAKKDEIWTIGQPSPVLVLPKDESVEAQVVEVTLYKSLPVPSAEVPIEDVLQFKERRNAELLAFRKAMDDLYLEIVDSHDLRRATERAVQKIEDSLVALNKVMLERKWKRFFPDVKVNLDLTDLVTKVTLGTTVGANFGLPAIGAAFGIVGSVISVKVDLSLKPASIPSDLRPFAYLHWAKSSFKELTKPGDAKH